jgi:hypothetical protein
MDIAFDQAEEEAVLVAGDEKAHGVADAPVLAIDEARGFGVPLANEAMDERPQVEGARLIEEVKRLRRRVDEPVIGLALR